MTLEIKKPEYQLLIASVDYYVIQRLFKIALIFVNLEVYRTRKNGRQF